MRDLFRTLVINDCKKNCSKFEFSSNLPQDLLKHCELAEIDNIDITIPYSWSCKENPVVMYDDIWVFGREQILRRFNLQTEFDMFIKFLETLKILDKFTITIQLAVLEVV